MKTFFIILIVLLFVLSPVIIIFISSFGSGTSLSFPPDICSFEYYKGLFTEELWLHSFITSIQISLLAIAISVPLGTSIAWQIRFHTNNRTFSQTLLIAVCSLPLAIPPILLGISFHWLTRSLSIPGTWWTLGVINAILGLPVVILIVGIKLRRFPIDLCFAASTCGATPIRILKTIVMPTLLPAFITSAIIVFMLTMEELVVALYVSAPLTTPISVRFWSSIQYNISPYVAPASVIIIMFAFLAFLLTNTLLKRRLN